MPECEMCGRKAQLCRAKVEGAVLSLCSSCAKLGKIIEPIKLQQALPKSVKNVSGIMEEFQLDPSFAYLIKSAREALGMSRKQLAEKLKIKESYLAKIEKGARPTIDEAKRIEKALGIKLIQEK